MRCWSPYNHFQNERMINNQLIFIYCSNNDCELFPFLSTQLLSGVPTNKIVVATDNEMVVSGHDFYLNDMYIVTQKKQISVCCYIHFDHIHIKTVDSDIVIITTAAFRKISSIRELWIEFGKGNLLTLF